MELTARDNGKEPSQASPHTHEKIVCIWIGTPNLEQLHQVMKLAVNVTTNRNRAFLFRSSQTQFQLSSQSRDSATNPTTYHGLHIRLFLQDFSGLECCKE